MEKNDKIIIGYRLRGIMDGKKREIKINKKTRTRQLKKRQNKGSNDGLFSILFVIITID